MAYSFYNYFGLIHNGSETNLSQLADNIQEKYSKSKSKIELLREPDQILITINDKYKFRIFHSDDPFVAAESKEMSKDFKEDFAGNPIVKKDIENCARRFEMGGEDDFNMDYFNDSLFIVSCLEKLEGVTVINVG